MKNTQSLKLNRDFRRVYKSDNFVGGYTVVYARKNKYPFNRLGLTVSKSTGKAVVRNRLKRLMRESYRHAEEDIEKGYDFIIVARGRAVGKTQSQIQKDIVYSMRKLGLIK
jgi:ribonuclease P protein component